MLGNNHLGKIDKLIHTDFALKELVEVAGVEPASEVKNQRTSTHLACFCFNLKLPNRPGSL